MQIPQADLFFKSLEGIHKYIYFTIAINGAAIAHGLQRFDSASLEWSTIPLLLSVLCWVISFQFGCSTIRRINGIVTNSRGRMVVLEQYDNFDEDVKKVEETNDVEHMKRFMKETKDSIDKNKRKMEEYQEESKDYEKNLPEIYQWHNRLIVWGVVFFALWHLLEMAIRSNYPALHFLQSLKHH